MASFIIKFCLGAVLILLPHATKGIDNFNLPPLQAPSLDKICDGINCGKGSCEAAPGDLLSFKCRCDSGWKRTRFDDDNKADDLEFLPCVIPNCSLDYTCMPAAPPVSSSIPRNDSLFDICNWMYCGEGTCTKNTTYTHTCQCNSGYQNLLNNSAFPCYSDCALGSNCEDLGITVSSSTTPGSANDNQATLFLPGKFQWIAILMLSATMTMLK